MGAKFTFDGEKLTKKNWSTKIANVSGDKIRAGSSHTTIATIRGDKICDGTSYTAIATIRSGYLCDKKGSKLQKMRDIDSLIEGQGEAIKAALWLYFIK